MLLIILIAVIVGLGLVLALAVEASDRLDARRMQRYATPESYWRQYLTEPPSDLSHRLARTYLRLRPRFEHCRRCLTPFFGLAHQVLRLVGHGRSPHNPKFCRRCMARLPFGGAEVEISILFADLRGSVGLAEHLSAREYSSMLNAFYECTLRPLIRHGAIVDKLVGDGVMALFVPAFGGRDHADRALRAGAEIVQSCPREVHLGVGVHTGVAFVGLVGSPDAMTDLTAIGDAVNVAARLAEAAQGGELLYSDVTATSAVAAVEPTQRRVLTVRGRSAPLGTYSFRSPEAGARAAAE